MASCVRVRACMHRTAIRAQPRRTYTSYDALCTYRIRYVIILVIANEMKIEKNADSCGVKIRENQIRHKSSFEST